MCNLRRFFPAALVLVQFYAMSEQVPTPPDLNSEIGYLQIVSDIEILPRVRKIFIIPQTKLPILEETEKSYVFLFDKKPEAVCCVVPKYAKFMVLISPSEDGKSAYFRGAIEADTASFKIKKGEELPVLKRMDDGYLASLKRANRNVPVFIPLKKEGILFSKESLFAKFAAEQKEKGFEYLNGEWMPANQAVILKDSQKAEVERRKRKWDDLKAGAENGTVVLRDGRVLHGTFRGGDNSQIFFESGGRTCSISPDDAADLDFKNIIAAGLLDSARQCVEKSDKIYAGDPGEAKRHAEQALKYLENIEKSTPEKFEQAVLLAHNAKENLNRIDEYLGKNGLSVYNYKVFPNDILSYHLKKGHMLLGGNNWINPDQFCKKCNGTGRITCLLCDGLGKIKKKCEKCDNGRVACHLCNGDGRKDCRICNAGGFLYKQCKRCGGSGYITTLCPSQRPYRDRVVIVDGSVMVISGSPYYFYPCYTTQTCPVCDGSGKMGIDCLKCGGRGEVPCPHTEKCKLCNGLGHAYKICTNCAGRRTTGCSDCVGKGFKGEIQDMPETVTGEDKGTISIPGSKSETMIP